MDELGIALGMDREDYLEAVEESRVNLQADLDIFRSQRASGDDGGAAITGAIMFCTLGALGQATDELRELGVEVDQWPLLQEAEEAAQWGIQRTGLR